MTKRICYIHVGPHIFAKTNVPTAVTAGQVLRWRDMFKKNCAQIMTHSRSGFGVNPGPTFSLLMLAKNSRLTTSRCVGQTGSRHDGFGGRITKMKAFAQDILLNPALGVGSTLEQSGEPERVGFKRINPESTRGQAFDLIYHNRSELRALLARDYD